MAENLVIVESPAKAKTIKKYLGKDFEVLASYGHVRDPVPKEGAVDPDKHFKMNYQSIERNEKHVDAIARALKKSKALYLATDPDREGEAISWHLRELLEERGDLKGKEVKRVVFYEITKGEVQRAVAEPRDLSLDLVNAQQARRALDYLVGFNLSPLLWKKVRRGLSAGRVQSPALRMICEREHEISIFNPQEYWTLEAEGEHSSQTFPLKLVEFNGQKVEQFSFTDEAAARGVEQSIKDSAQGFLHVVQIDRKQRPDHLHVYGLGESRRRRRARNPRSHRQGIRRRSRGRGTAGLQDQIAQCAGSARSHPPDLGGDPAVASRGQDRSGPVQAVRADLETCRGLADGARVVRHRCRGHAAGNRGQRDRGRRHHLARQRL